MQRPWILSPGRAIRILLATLCAGLLGGTVLAAEPTGIGEQIQPGWQTFESCPFGERPCGPVCMPESFSCCNKPTGTICPPGKSCCGTRCGCGRCEKCEEGQCVPDRKCRKDEQDQAASEGSTSTAGSVSAEGSASAGAGVSTGLGATVVPGAVLGIAILGAALETGSDTRHEAPPRRHAVSP
jgi:hypothetical protein